jgi:hypothetical protein
LRDLTAHHGLDLETDLGGSQDIEACQREANLGPSLAADTRNAINV